MPSSSLSARRHNATRMRPVRPPGKAWPNALPIVSLINRASGAASRPGARKGSRSSSIVTPSRLADFARSPTISRMRAESSTCSRPSIQTVWRCAALTAATRVSRDAMAGPVAASGLCRPCSRISEEISCRVFLARCSASRALAAWAPSPSGLTISDPVASVTELDPIQPSRQSGAP